MGRLRGWAAALKRDVVVLWLARSDPRVPWAAKVLAAFVVAYALSPIDLIPDVIPVLGLLDDLVLVPLGIWLVLRMIPAGAIDELRAEAAARGRPPASRLGVVLVLGLWAAIGLVAWLWWRGQPSATS